MLKVRRLLAFLALVTMLEFVPQSVRAQLNGLNIKGDVGLKAGSQAPPGPYVGGLFYWYDTNRINDRFGTKVNPAGSIDIFAGMPLLNVVTSKKILGANYGLLVALPIVNSSLEAPRFNSDPSAGLGDMYVMPLSLGWHFGRADVNAGYAFFAPTGRYSVNANDNTGLGMWAHELSLGTTVYLNQAKTWHASTSSAFEFHQGKRDSDAHVGTLLTLEGGFGRSFLKGAANAGLVYYAQWKLTQDTLTGLPALLVQGKNRSAALGPELSLPLATKNTLFGFLTFRYEWEVYARTTTQGNAAILALTFPLRPINIAPPPPPNRVPAASCSAVPNPIIAGSGTVVAVSADGSDPDSDPLTYSWTASGGTVDGTGPSVRWNATNLAAGDYRISATINDGKGGSANCDVALRIDPRPNRPPTVTLSSDRNSVLVGERLRFTAAANDPDGDPLSYNWSANGGRITGTTNSAEFDTTGATPGSYTATVRVDDGRSGAADASSSVTVSAPPPPPLATKISSCDYRQANSPRTDNVCKRLLDDVAVRLQNDPRATVVIVGFADPGERTPNTLAGNRATSAVNYLADEKSTDRSRISSRTGAGQVGADQANRRIDIIWVPAEATY